MKKKRTYNTRLVKDNYSYSVEQIADLFGIEVATVRRWIKEEGLVRIPKTRPILIHSSALKSFLENRKTKRKKTCKPHEVLCFKCKTQRIPKQNSGKAENLPNGSVRFRAKCGACNTKVNKTIKGADWVKNHPLFAYLQDASEQHKRKHSTPLKCQLQEDSQLCLNLIP